MLLSSEKRLIVAIDLTPTEKELQLQRPNLTRKAVYRRITRFMKQLEGTGCIVKFNSALRALGYGLIDEAHALGLAVFADLKLFDIPNTLNADGKFLSISKPELLTVVSVNDREALMTLKNVLPETEILGVSILTSMKNGDQMFERFRCRTASAAIKRFSKIAIEGG